MPEILAVHYRCERCHRYYGVRVYGRIPARSPCKHRCGGEGVIARNTINREQKWQHAVATRSSSG